MAGVDRLNLGEELADPGPAGDGALRAAAAGRSQPRLPAEVAAGRPRRGRSCSRWPGSAPAICGASLRERAGEAAVRRGPRAAGRPGCGAPTTSRRSTSSPRRSGPKAAATRLLERLGHEAADPIDELLARALQYQRAEGGSLQGFLRWFEAGGGEIKRDLDQNRRREVRILTVHALQGTAGADRLPARHDARAARAERLLSRAPTARRACGCRAPTTPTRPRAPGAARRASARWRSRTACSTSP